MLGCSASSPVADENGESSETVTGKLLHEEEIRGVKISFWETPTGLLGLARRHVDGPEQTKRIADSLKASSLGAAYRALHAAAGDSPEVPQVLLDADARYPASAVDATVEGAPANVTGEETIPAPAAQFDGVRGSNSDGVPSITQAVTAAENDAAVKAWMCISTQTCQVGFGSIYSGWIQNTSSYYVQYFNSSYDSSSSYGLRYQIGDRSNFVVEFSGRLQSRYVVEAYRYAGVGTFRRDAWISGWEPYPLTGTSRSVTFDQSKLLGPNIRVSMAQKWTAPSLKAFVGGSAQLHNFCVSNVDNSFRALPPRPSGKIRYSSQGDKVLPPFDAKLYRFASPVTSTILGVDFCTDIKATYENHIQGIGRLHTTADDNRWFVMSRSRPGSVGGAGLFLANIGDAPNVSGRLVAPGASFSGDPPANRRTYYYYPMSQTDHPGGFQVVGGLVAIAAEGASGAAGFVDFYDFRTPGTASTAFQRLRLDGSHGEPTASPNTKPTAAAMVKLSNGLYLLFVLNKDDQRSGRFYLSNSATLSSSTWWQWLSDVSWPARMYQNANFITQCDGKLFLAMTNNEGFGYDYGINGAQVTSGTNTADLFSVAFATGTQNVQLTFQYPGTYGGDDDGYNQFRAAGDFYVGRDNKLIMYSHAHHANTGAGGCPDSKLKLSEFAY